MIAGDVVNTAARLQTAAPVGAVLVGEETYAATRTSIEYQPGFSGSRRRASPSPCRRGSRCARSRRRASGRSHPVPIVGRERELEVLTGIWERVAEERRPQLVTVFGPAGIGKSRLALELMEHVGSQRGPRAARPLDAVRRVEPVQRVRAAREAGRDGLRQRRARRGAAKLAAAVARARRGRTRRRTTPRTWRCWSGSARRARRRIARRSSSPRALFVESLGTQGPTLLLFEDIHWADASLLDLIEMLAARVRDVPVLLPRARAAGAAHRAARAGQAACPRTRPSRSSRLSEDASQELAELLLDRSRRTHAPRASPRPPRATRSSSRSWPRRSPSARPPTRAAPTSVRAIVAARLDALPPRSGASSSTRRSSAGCSGAARSRGSRRDDDLRARSDRSRSATSCAGRPSRASRGEQQYAFKHALIRDVAYQRLPRAARRERHAAVAEFLVERPAPSARRTRRSRSTGARRASTSGRSTASLVAADQAARGWAKGTR